MPNGLIELIFVGDILPADRYYTQGFGNGSLYNRTGGSIWQIDIQKLFANSDIGFANLESPLVKKRDDASTPFAGDISFSKFLKKNGINIVSISNNHILEHGEKGFQDTVNTLLNDDLNFVGSTYNRDKPYRILRIKGKRIAIASFNQIHDFPNPGIYSHMNSEDMQVTLNEIKNERTDVIIFSLHWGDEYIHIPSLQQITLAKKLIDNGVNIIVGHHPHVVQPIERYKGGLIIYSLGNFLFGSNWSKKVRNGIAVRVGMNSNLAIDYKVIPVEMKKNFTIRVGGSEKWIRKTLKNSTEKMNYMINKGEQYYESHYLTILKREKLLSRLLMKVQMLKDWRKLNSQSKQLFLDNLKVKILNANK